MKSSNAWTRPTRRAFLKGGTAAMTGLMVGLPSGLHASRREPWLSPEQDGIVRDPRVKALLARALDAARNAGASYADGRITYTRTRSFFALPPFDTINLGLSVRALVNGYWGWAATPLLLTDEAPRIGTAAVALAKSLAGSGRPRVVEFAPMPVARGDWITPIKIDPFETALDELLDWGIGLRDYIENLGESRGGNTTVVVFGVNGIAYSFVKQERAFASTEGCDVTQTVYRTSAQVPFQYNGASGRLDHLGSVGAGWEFVRDNGIREAVRRSMDQIDQDIALPVKPVDIGRYDIVFGHNAMASLLSETFGEATQLDRALGYEANASGTSYLGPDPQKYLGSTVAAPAVTITANRSVERGLATIGWDDEGVVPADFTLVRDGQLVDYQTTREQASWLSSWYRQRGETPVSHGCAQAPTALDMPMQHTPNLALTPGQGSQDFETLISGLEKGLAVGACQITMDQQCLNGFGICGDVVEIRNGKRVSRAPASGVSSGTSPVGLLFRSLELWKNITGLGGLQSARLSGIGQNQKGDPFRTTPYSVSAVPAAIKQLAIIDPRRKAS